MLQKITGVTSKCFVIDNDNQNDEFFSNDLIEISCINFGLLILKAHNCHNEEWTPYKSSLAKSVDRLAQLADETRAFLFSSQIRRLFCVHSSINRLYSHLLP